MSDRWFVVHGHFYQPPRENPWTETVVAEPSAAPFHDWNERITAESYRPNAFARIVDEHGFLVGIVDNYELISFDVGPTLVSWLEEHAPDVYAHIVDAAAAGRSLGHPLHHVILPLAPARDVRTQVRWGMADHVHRFGHRPDGLWLPETAVSNDVLAVLVEEGVGFTVLAPTQALRQRPFGAGSGAWADVSNGSIDTRRAYRWFHPSGDGRSIDIVFYEGPLSHDIAFGLANEAAEVIIDRAVAVAGDGGLVCAAADGETFGHHHKFSDRALAYTLAVEAPRRRLRNGPLSAFLAEHPPKHEVEIRESAWSCAHGVGRWREDCGCSTGGGPGFNQKWHAPLRAALDLLAAHADEVFERRGAEVLTDPWAARDAYIGVVIGVCSREEFASRWVKDDDALVEALTLLEAQRHSLCMYTSCAWFFADVSGIETIQNLRYAARLIDLLREVGEEPPFEEFLAVLATAESNIPEEGTTADLWRREVETARVGPERAVAHLALVDLLEQQQQPAVAGGYNVVVDEHIHDERGSLQMCAGRVSLVHRRTGRRTERIYGALGLGGLEVVGATSPSTSPDEDHATLSQFAEAFESGVRVSALLRTLGTDFGPEEFGLESALPDAAGQILDSTAAALADRFLATYQRLYNDHSATLSALTSAGYRLPVELRMPAELALARQLEADLVTLSAGWEAVVARSAEQIALEAREFGLRLHTPAIIATLQEACEATVARAVAVGSQAVVAQALAVLRLARLVDVEFDKGRAQEMVYAALAASDEQDAPLAPLGRALGLAVGHLGVPR